MEFILAQLSILIWLSLISFILAKFSVQQLNILISGGTENATFSSQRGNSNIACLLSLCKAFPIFLYQHTLRAAMANIIKCPANTLPPLHTHTYTQTNTRTKPPLPSLCPYSFFPFFFFLAITQSQCTRERVHWSAKESSHFTGRVCAALLSLNGNCSFHLAALPIAD